MKTFKTAIELAKYITSNFKESLHEIKMNEGLRNKKVFGIYKISTCNQSTYN